MSNKSILYIYGVIAITLISIHCITANISDNEVNDIPETYMVQGVKVYQGDRECVLVGGLCVHNSDCNEPTSNKGLCPSNSHRGVECCYELPVRPAPCHEHLGECMDRCHKTLMRPGTDCENGQICCVLI
ncbi:U-scoloptoxin(19)-Tl1a [Calliphora vicina]|uniref:U-scoloptoxin(19)-Tl1a n=1 Tax=Calliphora vicina TaxID=7373 RepID=UPI00325B92C9